MEGTLRICSGGLEIQRQKREKRLFSDWALFQGERVKIRLGTAAVSLLRSHLALLCYVNGTKRQEAFH